MKINDFAEQEAKKIFNSLADENNFYLNNHISLLGGQCGIILFFFYYGKIMNDESSVSKAYNLLQSVTSKTGSLNDFSLGNGLLGLTWLFNHLYKEKLIDKIPNFDEIDEVNEILIDKYVKRKNYDSFYGLIGIGQYYLEKVCSKSEQIKWLNIITDRILLLSKEDADGIYWDNHFSVERSSPSQQAQDLGLAHGIPSIIVYLCKVYELGVNTKNLPGVICRTCYWLLSKESSYSNVGKYPQKLIDNEHDGISRLAWCYGDLGVGISLMKAYEITNDETIGNKAKSILHDCSTRTVEQSKVYHFPEANYIDGGLCHGTVGLAYIFWRLYKSYKDEHFLKAFRNWMNISKKYSNSDRPLGGHIKFMYDTNTGYSHWLGVTGLLDGAAGIGLCYLTILNDDEQIKWDSIFSIN